MIIVTLTKNSVQTIEKTADSILKQTNKDNIIWYIVDDNSTDQTLNIIEKYKINTKVIKGPDQGVFKAYNFIIKYIREKKINDIIFFLHSDDIIYNENILHNVEKVFNKFNIRFLFGNIAYFLKDEKKLFRFWKSNFNRKQIQVEDNLFKLKNFIVKDLLTGWVFPHNSFFFHSSTLESLPNYSEEYPVCSDYLWSIKILLDNKFQFYFLNSYIIRMRYGGMSTTSKNLMKQQIYDFKIIKDFFYNIHKSYFLCIITFFGKKLRKIKQFF